jgi:segregation and condensation protein A
MAEELTFHLEEFEGPLELLLALVSKHKMDLHNIPILELIDQYTRTVEAAQAADPDISSAFIEMAAHLVEMKSYLLLPRSTEGERMKQELTGQLIEYDQCRRMASALRAAAEATPTFVRQPMQLERDETYALNHLPQVLADCWEGLMGRAPVRRMPTQAVFEPLVTAPQVSVSSRVVYILRRLIAGGAARMNQLFARSQSRSTNVATFLALLELVRGGRVTLGPKGELTMQRGRLPRERAKEEE